MLFLVVAIIIFALLFDFLNGANDRANAIATTTATKAMTPTQALIVASIFNGVGALVSTKVAETIGKGIILPEYNSLLIILAGVLGASLWTFLCTKSGVPISVTHSLIGGLMGAGIAAGGLGIINWEILTNKIFLAIILGPSLGLLAGAFFLILISWIIHSFCKKIPTNKTENFFRKGQLLTTPFMAFTHGMNDTQNAMGIITAALLFGGYIHVFSVPLWVKLACGIAMGLGTFILGWRVMKTLGWKLTKVEPKHGFAAEIGAGTVIGIKSLLGMPVSTTHVVCSAVIGGTILENWRRIKQAVAQTMIISWIITIPCSCAIGILSYWLINFLC
jgi:PiT family inorganic phosphate transporter